MSGNHRVPGSSRTGRSLIQVGLEAMPWTLSAEIRAHNKAVDEKKAVKRAAAKQRQEQAKALKKAKQGR